MVEEEQKEDEEKVETQWLPRQLHCLAPNDTFIDQRNIAMYTEWLKTLYGYDYVQWV